jgi:hypothetical protein
MNEYMMVLRKDGKIVSLHGARTSALVDRAMHGRWKACALVSAKTLDEAIDKFVELMQQEKES